MSSMGVSSRAGSALAYSGWWVTGALVWFVERRDPVVRFHAAQALVVFGAAALLVLAFGGLAAVALSFFPSLFGIFAGTAGLIWLLAVGLWGRAMWTVARGGEWRIPAAAALTNRLAGR